MQNEIMTWGFGDQLVRTLAVNGDPWFVGKDVAAALGYQNPIDAIQKHVDEDDKAAAPIQTTGGVKDAVIINESGLYSLIFGSKMEAAKSFKKWVTSEVLPAIRKTGTYNAAPTPSFREECLRLIDSRIKDLAPRDTETARTSSSARLMRQQIDMLSKVESLVDKGLIKKEDFKSVIEGFNRRSRSMEPLAALRQREVEENAKIMAFASSRLRLTGSDADWIPASDLYTLYLDSTEGDVVKEFTFKSRFETMFPSTRYAMKEDNGFLEQVVYGVRLRAMLAEKENAPE